MLLSFVFIITQVWLDLTMPEYIAEITRLVQTSGSSMPEILSASGMMLLCALGSLAAAMLTAVCSSRIAANFSSTLRSKLFAKVESFSMEEIGRFSTASLITRSTNDVTQVQMLIVLGLQMLIKAPITAVWAICKISGKQWQWSLSTASAVVVLLVVGITLLLTFPYFKKMQILTDDLNRVTRENLTGIRVVRAYNADEYQIKKFESANDALTSAHLFTQRTMAFITESGINATRPAPRSRSGVSNLDRSHLSRILEDPLYVRADKEVYRYFLSKRYEMLDDIEAYDGIHGLFVHAGLDDSSL